MFGFHKPRRRPPILNLMRGIKSPAKKLSRAEIFCDQLVDSLIVGGIGGFTTFLAAGEDATLKGFAIAFGLAFLVKMKEYRKIKD